MEPEEYSLPHPPYGPAVVLVIHRAIQRAFAIMREKPDIDLDTMTEDEITINLRAVLTNRLRKTGEVDGFNRFTFEKVMRQHQCVSYDNAHLAKEPDMCFTLCDDSRSDVLDSEDGMVTECKPVDSEHNPGSHYCDRGIKRFVDGEYAWAMPESLMVGYVRKDRTIKTSLIPAMKKDKQTKQLKTVTLPAPVEESECDEELLHASSHRREFQWRENKGPASDITVYHSWHMCD